MKAWHRLGLAGALFASAATLAAETPGGAVELGRQLYRDGASRDGLALHATVAGDAALTGTAAACASCHRRSGLGSAEGGKVIAAVTAPILFNPRHSALPGTSLEAAAGGRPAYTETTLRRAIREGIDPGGRKLSPLMPRYALDDAGLDALIAYLKTLTATPAPGVTADRLHLATIVTDGVDEQTRWALLGVLERYVAGHNAEIRQETRRGQRAVLGHARAYRAYRKWDLHVWSLNGPADGWAAQLDRYYRAQPVFAVVSGAGRGAWRPVHEFCEQRELPCLFPNIDAPPEEVGFYSLYFSRGLSLEADLIARDLSARAAGRRVVQVHRDDESGRTAAAALRRALAASPEVTLNDQPLPVGQTPAAVTWSDPSMQAATDVVFWLSGEDLATVAAGAVVPPKTDSLYLSSTLVDDPESALPAELRPRARLVDTYDPPASWQARRARLIQWLQANGTLLDEERVQANAYFAITLVSHTLQHLRENYSREYLVERLEHATENAPWSSVYRTLSLGRGQRFASKGGYVIPWRPEDGFRDAGEWIVPFRTTRGASGG